MRTAIQCSILVFIVQAAFGAIKTETIQYKEGDTSLEGFLAHDDSIVNKRPGVLVVHQWKGLGDYEKKRAEMLARLGYNVFCVDIYGKGIRPNNPKDASAEAGKYKSNRPLLRTRVNAGLDVVRQHELTEPKR